jgi:hypothetical protein
MKQASVFTPKTDSYFPIQWIRLFLVANYINDVQYDYELKKLRVPPESPIDREAFFRRLDNLEENLCKKLKLTDKDFNSIPLPENLETSSFRSYIFGYFHIGICTLTKNPEFHLKSYKDLRRVILAICEKFKDKEEANQIKKDLENNYMGVLLKSLLSKIKQALAYIPNLRKTTMDLEEEIKTSSSPLEIETKEVPQASSYQDYLNLARQKKLEQSYPTPNKKIKEYSKIFKELAERALLGINKKTLEDPFGYILIIRKAARFGESTRSEEISEFCKLHIEWTFEIEEDLRRNKMVSLSPESRNKLNTIRELYQTDSLPQLAVIYPDPKNVVPGWARSFTDPIPKTPFRLEHALQSGDFSTPAQLPEREINEKRIYGIISDFQRYCHSIYSKVDEYGQHKILYYLETQYDNSIRDLRREVGYKYKMSGEMNIEQKIDDDHFYQTALEELIISYKQTKRNITEKLSRDSKMANTVETTLYGVCLPNKLVISRLPKADPRITDIYVEWEGWEIPLSYRELWLKHRFEPKTFIFKVSQTEIGSHLQKTT